MLSKVNSYFLWILLILLTVILLSWPTHYQYKYEAVQAVSSLENPILFGIVLSFWTSGLLVIAKREKPLCYILLLCIFSMTYIAFWIINCPYICGGSFDPGGIGYSKYILEHAHITIGDPKWGYFEFPLNSIFGAILSQITDLAIPSASKIFLVFASILLALSAYIFFFNSLNNPWKSFLGVIVAMMGNVQMILTLNFFRPGTMGLLYVASILALLGLRTVRRGRTSAEVVALVVMALSVGMTHFISSVTFLFIFLGMYLYQQLAKRSSISFNMIILVAVAYLTWWFYISIFTTQFVLDRAITLLSEPAELSLFFALRKGELLLTEQVPIWATIVRVLWLIVLYLLPIFVAIQLYINSFLFKKKVTLEESLGGLFGLLLLSGIMTLLDIGANRSIQQFLLFSTFFTPPILISFLSDDQAKYLNRIGKRVFIFPLILIVVLSFPTFLAHNPSVNTQIFYEREHSTLTFIQANCYDGVNLFSDADTGLLIKYYLPEVNYNVLPYAPDYVKDEVEFLNKLPQYMKAFEDSGTDSLFVYSPRITHRSYIMFGMPEDHPIWREVLQILEYKNDKIYNNGFIWVFANE